MENTLSEVLSTLQRICSKQEKCKADIADYMVRKGIPAEYHQTVLSQLMAGRFVDEERYAKAAVRDKFMLYRWGRQKIRHFLETKQISAERIDRALDTIDESDYRKMIEEEMHKKGSGFSVEEPGVKEMKLMRFAASRGYEEELVREICRITGPENRG